ncbi:MAG: glycerophosphodiester phosphodiesterase [Lachnospiraceae bacterium]|jgi:glycerophosphoryl diester phosphodiesterase|nr:glycerophosphodiester phosphodiesterase [Lachnospiraceae bacterium]MCI1329151.1 glycerophosphodiester phosphodiesterase [Lachnospiraceae bacterium]
MNTMITAHSGADHTEENSIDFVRYALASGIGALEVDVRMEPETRLLTLGHDHVTKDSALLSEAFRLIAQKPSVRVNCDLKEHGIEEAVFNLAKEYRLEDRLIYSGSFGVGALDQFPEIRKHARVFLNIEEYVPNLYETLKKDPSKIRDAAGMISSVCTEHGIGTVNTYYELAVPEFQKILADAGIGVSVWTVNDEKAIRSFLDRGVTNITTRNLTGALHVLDEYPA